MPDTLASNVIAALIFAVLGISVFLIAFVAVDRLTPYALWREIIDEHNTALAILIGSIALGMSIIVAAAII
jgi:putative membrane protein